MPQKSSDQLANNLHDVMMETLPSLVKEKVTKQVKKEVPGQVRDQVPVYVVKGLIMEGKQLRSDWRLFNLLRLSYRMWAYACLKYHHRFKMQLNNHSLVECIVIAVYVPSYYVLVLSAVRPRDQDDPHDDAHPEGENSAKRQKTSKYEAYVSGESSSGQVNVEEPGPSIQFKAVKEILEAPALSLINQDLLYLKKGNSGPEKIVLSLHKFPAIVFNDDDIEERTSRWEKVLEDEGRKSIQTLRSFKSARHAEWDYKNLNKNDIEDMYLLIMNNKVPDYANTGLLWSLSVLSERSVIWEKSARFIGIEAIKEESIHCIQLLFPGMKNVMCAKELTYDAMSVLKYLKRD
ncbi:hypothetical protein Tco_1505506 [Tanacetum coccineum]